MVPDTDIVQAMARHGLHCAAVTPIEIRHRLWLCVAFEEEGQPLGDHPHLALIHTPRDWLEEADLLTATGAAFRGRQEVLARIHSECILGDAFGSTMCDCGEQMRLAMDAMETRREGLFVYLRQEGRGIGLRNKLDCLALQYGFSDGKQSRIRHSAEEAKVALGFEVDARHYTMAAGLVASLGIRSVQLMTGNRRKIADLEAAGVTVSSALCLPLETPSPREAAQINGKVARAYSYPR